MEYSTYPLGTKKTINCQTVLGHLINRHNGGPVITEKLFPLGPFTGEECEKAYIILKRLRRYGMVKSVTLGNLQRTWKITDLV